MGFLIDGHNLIGQLPDLRLDDPNDEAKLVQKLMGFCARTRKKCVVVFDAGLPGGWSKLSTAPVEVIFASPGTNADRIMRERIQALRDPRQWTVVSNDREVLAAAQARKVRTLRSVEFAPLLHGTAVGAKTPPPAPGKTPEVEDAGSAANPRVSPAEVEQWLNVFKTPEPPPRRRK
ncbi:MAG: NYN domain-containing protein [Anaerolineae bacterium]|nr:NYN domain-containing protein [Anaerolineae bacterium]NUQ03364.1 NYN domain-containing protein [Anaerolineae bacterium]